MRGNSGGGEVQGDHFSKFSAACVLKAKAPNEVANGVRYVLTIIIWPTTHFTM